MLEVPIRARHLGRNDAALPQRIVALRAHYPAPDPTMVADVVRAVLETMRGDLSARETSLLTEVEELAETIAAARAEIAALAGRRHHREPHPVRDRRTRCDRRAYRGRDRQHPGGLRDAGSGRRRPAGRCGDGNAGRHHDGSTRRAASKTSPGSASPRWSATLKTIDGKVAQILAAFGGQTRARRCRSRRRLPCEEQITAEWSATAGRRDGPNRYRQAAGEF